MCHILCPKVCQIYDVAYFRDQLDADDVVLKLLLLFLCRSVGDVMMFGKGIDGQLGFKKLQDLSTPRLLQVLSDKGVRRIACGKSHTVCCTESGDTYSWGSSPHLVGRQGSPFVPSLIPALEGVNIRHVACGDNFTVAISGMAFSQCKLRIHKCIFNILVLIMTQCRRWKGLYLGIE
jgi:hypothetical protein